ncbi:MAG: DUF4159 domain-containing protein [Candidatus Latescibacterota bacterium]
MHPPPVLLLLLVLVGAAGAQEPALRARPAVPEPERRSPGAGPFVVTVVHYHTAEMEHDVFPLAVPELVAHFRRSVARPVALDWAVRPLFDRRVAESVLLYLTGQDAVLPFDEGEQRALGEYLRAGGLLFAEDVRDGVSQIRPPAGAGVTGTPFDSQLKALIRSPLVLGQEGDLWRPVPREHPLYTGYFRFPDGPPLSAVSGGNVRQLEMIELYGRTAVVFSDLNLSWYWGHPNAEGRERVLQLGANLLVHALTQHLAGQPLVR